MAKSIGPQPGFAAATATAARKRMFYAKTGLVSWQHNTPELPRHQSHQHAQLGSAESGEER